jgi:hypothetical protein
MLLDDAILLTHPVLQVPHALLQGLQLLHMHMTTCVDVTCTVTWHIMACHNIPCSDNHVAGIANLAGRQLDCQLQVSGMDTATELNR